MATAMIAVVATSRTGRGCGLTGSRANNVSMEDEIRPRRLPPPNEAIG
jgi:hypothetical protein